jgi:hypothetical protein
MMDRTHTNQPSFPAAEDLARRMRLPLTACPVTRELYGYTVPLLDRGLAARQLAAAGHPVGTPAHEAAMGILEARAALFAERGC